MDQYLLLGASGQLGQELRQLFLPEELLFKTREVLDFTNGQAVRAAIEQLKPTVVINVAAMTNPYACLKKPREAWLTNAVAVDHIVKCCAINSIPLIHVSDAAVFGRVVTEQPLRETAPIGPIEPLGQSKAAGEQAVLGLSQCMCPEYWNHGFRYWLLRTAKLFGRFMSPVSQLQLSLEMLRGTRHETRLQRPNDVVSSYTYAPHLARAIHWLVEHRLEVVSGVYHIANSGDASEAEFLQTISLKLGLQRGVDPVPLSQLDSKYLPIPTELVPRYTVLDTAKWHEIAPFRLPHWRDAVGAFVKQIPK